MALSDRLLRKACDMDVLAYGWCCTDCMVLIANGETPPEMSEDETKEWVEHILERNEGYSIVPGGKHEEGCTAIEKGNDCNCETREFSWSACDYCGSGLGGTRHTIAYFKS